MEELENLIDTLEAEDEARVSKQDIIDVCISAEEVIEELQATKAELLQIIEIVYFDGLLNKDVLKAVLDRNQEVADADAN